MSKKTQLPGGKLCHMNSSDQNTAADRLKNQSISSHSVSNRLVTAGIEFNSQTGEVHALDKAPHKAVNEKPIRLSPVNRRVLNALIQAGGEAVSRTQLFDVVWPNQVVSDDALTRSISDLRAQLKPLTTTHPLIATIPKVGYRWLPTVNVETKETELKANPNFVKQQFIPIVLALILLFLIIWALLSWLQKDRSLGTKNLVILNDNSRQSLAISDCFKQAIAKHEKLRYLSEHAIETHPGNPYPYFSHEFGVHWFIEHQIITYNKIEQISFNLIDAKTGLVVFEQRHNLNSQLNPNQSTQWCQTFINKVAEL